jgi:RNA polymerase sigma factor (sigma-70 family)
VPVADSTTAIETVFRIEFARLVAGLTRFVGDVGLAEELAQDALVAALEQWPDAGVPAKPGAWLMSTAKHRAIDSFRRARRLADKTEQLGRSLEPVEEPDWAAALDEVVEDDVLRLVFIACHPVLSREARVALTLRLVGGLTTAEIARAFLVPEATMTRRITRAKQSIKASGARFALPPDRVERLDAVLQVIYLIFNEGYASTSGPSLQRVELSAEGIRLARMVHRLLPDDSEVAGLLALMLLTDARRPARTGPGGELIPMAEQDRSRWIADSITEGVALITDALPRGSVGPYQLQAAIAAVHDEAPSADKTDWPQIVALYEVLMQLSDNPMVALNHVVAVAMARSAQEGLDLLGQIQDDERIAKDHRLYAVRAHLLEMAGDATAARAAYEEAAERATSLPQQRYLNGRAARLP